MYNYVRCGSCAPAVTASHALATLSAADSASNGLGRSRILAVRASTSPMHSVEKRLSAGPDGVSRRAGGKQCGLWPL